MKNWILSLLATIGLCSSCDAKGKIEVLSPQNFEKEAKADTTAVILDVRQPDEYAEGHLEGAILLDFLATESFNEGLKSLDKDKTYYVYCRSGRRSNGAATEMQKQGFKVRDMKGGILAWKEAGLKIVK